MALHSFVKISAVTNLTDARYCAGMYVNMIGFDLEESSKNFTSPQKYNEITGWLSGVDFVAEFESTHPEKILGNLNEYNGINFLEITEEIYLRMLVNSSYGIIFKKELTSEEDLDELIAKAKFFQDFKIMLHLVSESLEINGGIIQKLHTLASTVEVLLGFGIEPETVRNLLEQTGVKGIALEGGDEIKPGLKDFDQLAEILEVLEIED
ncbi:phosphoribosylanthranilate isomerase [Aquiflexum gelatinilyticum]|uniref:phosphoribosylanthranilate isomerase n=1 Tax=Aquiflexum gelatinilyticum TaxID=2961943 RepID=UPI0021673B5F|nr:phosphoribosylanthranilate isomerase [Aquiflexum gelatinilyticum]MCS4434606.1 phosphoribosylanthranilate isomerase [Aquiflexum gelatinilyticum]